MLCDGVHFTESGTDNDACDLLVDAVTKRLAEAGGGDAMATDAAMAAARASSSVRPALLWNHIPGPMGSTAMLLAETPAREQC